ncbi:MAG: hypothetical protein PHE84_16025 [bacterium]|nr:hypothetical protein [bacterium]
MSDEIKGSVERHIGLMDEGGHPNEPIEWWYYNTIISAPGTPIDGWVAVTILTSFRNVLETVHGLLIPPAGETVDLSGYDLPSGSIKFSEEKVDVSWNKNWCRGLYPKWTVHYEGKHAGKGYKVDLELEADIDSNAYTYRFENNYLNHFVVFRNRTKGKVTIDKNAYPITGIGYYEHFYGFMNLLAMKGWHWYWCPVAGADRLAVNIGLGVMQDNTVPLCFLHFTPDGKNFYQLDQYDFRVLKDNEFNGIEYPGKFSIEQKKADRELQATITRTPSAYQRLNETMFGKAMFVTGNAGLEGKLKWQGKEYDLKGRAFGSSMLVKLNQ